MYLCIISILQAKLSCLSQISEQSKRASPSALNCFITCILLTRALHNGLYADSPTGLVSVINAINSIIIESCNAQMRNVAAAGCSCTIRDAGWGRSSVAR